MPLAPEKRARLIETLTAWIDSGFADDGLPEGFPESEVENAAVPDWLTIVTTMTRLSEEVRLQGKHFRKLSERLGEGPHAGPPAQAASTSAVVKPGTSLVGGDSATVPLNEVMTAVREEERAAWLETLIDLHDRLHRTLAEAENQLRKAGWWRRVVGVVPVEKALADGLRLIMHRFSDLLAEHETRRFGTVGDRFDPAMMKAVDAIEPSTTSYTSGTVVAVIASGYLRRGRILRMANVQVVR